MTLKCCNKEILYTQIRYFLGDNEFPKRFLEWGSCPICGADRAVLHREDVKGNYKPLKPNKVKNSLEFVKNLLQQEQFFDFLLLKVRTGSKSNMYYTYNDKGIIKDFNGEKKGSCETPINFIKL